MIFWTGLAVAVWIALSLPCGVLLGKFVAYSNRSEAPP